MALMFFDSLNTGQKISLAILGISTAVGLAFSYCSKEFAPLIILEIIGLSVSSAVCYAETAYPGEERDRVPGTSNSRSSP